MEGLLLDSMQNYDFDTKEVEFGITDVVYRAMGIDELFDIIFKKEWKFEPTQQKSQNGSKVFYSDTSNTWGTHNPNTKNKFHKCFFRTPENALNFILTGSQVIVEFDKDVLKQIGKLRPFDYGGYGDGKYEFEERLYTQKEFIKIKDPHKLVKQIWVLTSEGIPYIDSKSIEKIKSEGYKIRLFPKFGYESDDINYIDSDDDEDAYYEVQDKIRNFPTRKFMYTSKNPLL